jgi:hypothetical protein
MPDFQRRIIWNIVIVITNTGAVIPVRDFKCSGKDDLLEVDYTLAYKFSFELTAPSFGKCLLGQKLGGGFTQQLDGRFGVEDMKQ